MSEEIKSCPSCGADNWASARYCGRCGSEIAETVHCQRCGSEQAAELAFCTECGASLHQQGVVVPEVAKDAPTRVDRCACGGLMKPAYKVGNGALSEVGGWLFGGERRLFWVCQSCGQMQLHETEVAKQRAKEAAESAKTLFGCLLGIGLLIALGFLLKACIQGPF